MTKDSTNCPETPAMTVNIDVPGFFVDWAAGELHRRGFDRVDPPIIAFIFQEIVDRGFDHVDGPVNLNAAVDTAIDKYDFALAQLCEERFPPRDARRH